MAEDTRKDYPLTVAELCQAIADGRIAYNVRKGYYQVKHTDVRRIEYENRRPLAETAQAR